MHKNVLDLGEHLLEGNSNTDEFKFIKLPTIPPSPMALLLSKGHLSNDSIGNALHSVSEMTGPVWIKLILECTKPFAGAILSSPNALHLLPALKKD